ncbi:MAG: hypothetical protein ABUT20_46650 [Bacteroidota bacterium]
MKPVLPLCLFISAVSLAQSPDFMMLKKHNKTVETFYAGSNIDFTTTSGAYINGVINKLKNDTLYIQEFITRYLPTTFGTYIIDTAGSYHYQFHYNQIAAIGKKENKGFNTKGSGAALLGGGTVIALASGVVYLVDRKKFSAPLLIASTALATAGYFMAKGGSKGMTIGKKYKLVYMNMHANQP